MASKRIILFILVLCMSPFHRGNAQELKVGDPIPSFNPCGWLNATPIQKLERGKVYVIEFWASWCGPCIAGMPHVSDLSEQLKGKAEFIAVNTSDWSSSDSTLEMHRQTIAKFAEIHKDKLRFAIALDDEKNSIAKSWMTALQFKSLPCSIIVNRDQTVAWVGRSSKMDGPLLSVLDGSFDVGEFRKKYEREVELAKREMETRMLAEKAIQEAANAGDIAAFDKAIETLSPERSQSLAMGLGIATRANSAFALKVIRSKLDDPNETDEEMYGWCAKLMSFVNMTRDKSLLPSALSISEQCVRKSPEGERCLAAMYHARSLAHVGRFEEAEKYIKISLEAVDSFEPATRRTSIRSSIEKEANKIRESLASAKIE